MATLRDHINLEISNLKAKLEKLEVGAPHLLSTEITKLHDEYMQVQDHLWTEHAQAEHSPPKPVAAGSDAATSTASA